MNLNSLEAYRFNQPAAAAADADMASRKRDTKGDESLCTQQSSLRLETLYL